MRGLGIPSPPSWVPFPDSRVRCWMLVPRAHHLRGDPGSLWVSTLLARQWIHFYVGLQRMLGGDGFWKMSMYSAPYLVCQWIHAHASVYAAFGRLVVFLRPPCIWQSLVRLRSCLRSTFIRFFWETTSRYMVLSASSFDSGYMSLPVSSFCGYCFRIQRNAWISAVHAVRQSQSSRFSTFFT